MDSRGLARPYWPCLQNHGAAGMKHITTRLLIAEVVLLLLSLAVAAVASS